MRSHAPDTAFAAVRATVLGEDLVRQGKPRPVPLSLVEKGLEDVRQVIGDDSRLGYRPGRSHRRRRALRAPSTS